MNDCYQDCNNKGNTTTTQGVPHLFDIGNPFNYVIFPLDSAATDLHIVTYDNGTAYFMYNGYNWNLDHFKEDSSLPEPEEDCYEPCVHTHEVANINGLTTALVGKANLVHTHSIQDVVGLEGYINSLDTLLDQLLAYVEIVEGTLNAEIVTRTAQTAALLASIEQLDTDLQEVIDNPYVLNTTAQFTGDGTPGLPLTLASNAVATINIQNSAVDSTKLADNSVVENKIQNNAVTENKIANNSVTTNKILDGNVTSAKLATSGVIAGTYNNPTVTLNDKGIVTSASNGTGITIEEALNASLVNITTSFVDVVTITLGAGTWKVDGIVNSDNTLGTNELFEAELYDTTNSTLLFASWQRVGNSCEVSMSMTKKVILTGTTTIALRMKVSAGTPVVAINGAIITAIK